MGEPLQLSTYNMPGILLLLRSLPRLRVPLGQNLRGGRIIAMELNPNNPVSRAAHNQWHKIAALVMQFHLITIVRVSVFDDFENKPPGLPPPTCEGSDAR